MKEKTQSCPPGFMITQARELLEGEEGDETILRQRRNALRTKLQTLQTLDLEILDSIDEDVIEEEVMCADEARERVKRALIQLNGALGLSRPTSPATHRVASTPTDGGGVEEEDTALEDTASGETLCNGSAGRFLQLRMRM